MAPDRGSSANEQTADARESSEEENDVASDEEQRPSLPDLSRRPSLALNKTRSDFGCYARNSVASKSATDGTNFTFRSTLVGLVIGVVICFSNTYFGLQTGWVSGMAMPASLIGFGFFKTISKYLTLPFTPVENVLVQTVAGAVGTMPLGCGFVGVIPALEFLLKRTEGAPIELGMGRLMLWSLGVCLFGVVFAVPLRKEVIIREKLKFPSGTATALMIGVLHGGVKDREHNEIETEGTEEIHALLQENQHEVEDEDPATPQKGLFYGHRSDWKAQIRLLLIAFFGSAFYTLFQYFFPQVRNVPIFGTTLASAWLWTLNPSPAYVGQGLIMGPATTIHMLLGAIVGWGVLSPLAKKRGYAPGKTSDWEHGSKGWIVWVSLAIMIADATVNLGWLVLKPLIHHAPTWARRLRDHSDNSSSWRELLFGLSYSGYTVVGRSDRPIPTNPPHGNSSGVPDDAPPHHLVPTRTILILLPLTLIFCIVCIQITFSAYISISLTLLSTLVALLLSIMGIRALGETDLNPVSGISKLTQLIFALVVPPKSSQHHDHAIIINLIAGAVSESGALQAGDMMQDLKAGHLIGASPKAQFYGQIIGSIVGAIVSAAVYKLYVSVYTVPGEMFQVPTAYVWIFTARLVTGQGLPPMAWLFALGAGVIFIISTSLRIYLAEQEEASWLRKLQPYVPGGIAVAVGMYNTPSFTMARTVGGLINWWWIRRCQGEGETKVIVLASGLILGEGVVSILNLGLASAGVSHL
jgi:OPT family oligopeptide transporter